MGGRGASILLQAVTLGLLARAFGVALFGVHASLLSVFYLYMMVFDFGLSVRALRAGAETRDGLPRAMLKLRLITVLPLPLVGAVGAFVVGPSDMRLEVSLATAVFVAGDVVAELATSVMLGARQRNGAVVTLVARRIVALVPFAVGVTVGAGVVSLIAAGLGGFVQGFVLLRKGAKTRVTLRSLIAENRSYWATSLSGNIQRSDVLLVGMAGGTLIAGYYGAATRLSNPLNTLTSILLQFGIPEVSAAEEREKRDVYRSLRRAIFAYATFLFLLSGTSKWLVPLILGREYADGWPILWGVIVSAGLSAVGQAQLAWHLSSGLPAGLPARMTLGVLGGLVLLMTATAWLGVWGAALGLVAGNILVLLAITKYGHDRDHNLPRQETQKEVGSR